MDWDLRPPRQPYVRPELLAEVRSAAAPQPPVLRMPPIREGLPWLTSEEGQRWLDYQERLHAMMAEYWAATMAGFAEATGTKVDLDTPENRG
jgi:hypothetical protein